MSDKVQVLLSTYNGEKYLEQLLNSVIKQKTVNVCILARDDGSKDGTVGILNRYSQEYNINIMAGENLGFIDSFWRLVNEASGADYYAFCDQDDVWEEDKLCSAVEMLKNYDCPALYTSNAEAVDNELNTISAKAFEQDAALSVAGALKHSRLPGCTFVFNNKLLLELQKYNGLILAHDWITTVIAAATGVIIYDQKTHLKYRIHSGNSIGLESKTNALIQQVKRFFKPTCPNARSRVAADVYSTYKEKMDKETAELFEAFAYYRNNNKYIKRVISEPELSDVIFKLLLYMEKV